MTTTQPIALFLSIGLVSASCVHNPAVHPAPDKQELFVKSEDSKDLLLRGTEPLDEQDFYELTGDHESYDAVHDARSSGEHSQTLGGTLMIVGLAAILGGAASLQIQDSNGNNTVPEWATYGALIGGLLLMTTGGGIYRSGKSRARPSERMFDAAHAQHSIEVMRYGAAGLTAASINTLTFSTENAKLSYCGHDGAKLTPLVAKDKMSFAIKLEGHEDWIEWSTKPDGQLSHNSVISPLNATLAALGESIDVMVKAKGGTSSQKLTLVQDLTCHEHLGDSGESGGDGQPGAEGRMAARGSDGTAGGAGGDGPSVEVEAAFVNAPGHDHLLLVVSKRGNQSPEWALVDPSVGSVAIDAIGGHGGSGGSGGSGGPGGSRCEEVNVGGPGANGGPGGPGGRGGRVVVRGANEAAISHLSLLVDGGQGGSAGRAGYGGRSGGNGSCYGSAGSAGNSGVVGVKGADGTHHESVVSARELSMIQAALETNPAITLAR